MTTAEQRRVWEKLRRWREDPITMVREAFGAEPDAWQTSGRRLRRWPFTTQRCASACSCSVHPQRRHPNEPRRDTGRVSTPAVVRNGAEGPADLRWRTRHKGFRRRNVCEPTAWWLSRRPVQARASETARAMFRSCYRAGWDDSPCRDCNGRRRHRESPPSFRPSNFSRPRSGVSLEMGGDGDIQLVEQALLLRRGLCDASKPDLPAVGRGQHNVGALQGRELRERLGW